MTEYYVKYSTLRPIDLIDHHFEDIIRKRLISFAIDASIVATASALIAIIKYLINKEAFSAGNEISSFIIFWILYNVFHLSFTKGMTFGMRHVKIKLVSSSGNPPHQLSTMFMPVISSFIYLMVLFAPADFLLYFTGEQESINPAGFWCLVLLFLPFINSKKRALQEFLCGVTFIRSDV